MVSPKAMHANASEIPELETESFRVRVLHGTFEGRSASHHLVTDVTLLHIFLEPDQLIVLPASSMAFAYGLRGKGISNNQTIMGQVLLNYELEGDTVMIKANSPGLEFMFGTGKPLNEPIVYGGPFVMTTREQMTITQSAYAKGSMGRLAPYTG